MDKATLKMTIDILQHVIDNHEWCSYPMHTCACGSAHATPCDPDKGPLCKGCEARDEAVALVRYLLPQELEKADD